MEEVNYYLFVDLSFFITPMLTSFLMNFAAIFVIYLFYATLIFSSNLIVLNIDFDDNPQIDDKKNSLKRDLGQIKKYIFNLVRIFFIFQKSKKKIYFNILEYFCNNDFSHNK